MNGADEWKTVRLSERERETVSETVEPVKLRDSAKKEETVYGYWFDIKRTLYVQ